jgi:hypothetical protein
MDWTWYFDDVAAPGIAVATVAGAILSLVLSAAVGVWLLCCGACRRWAALPRPLRGLGSPYGRAAAAAFVLLSWDGLYLNNGGQNAAVILLGFGLQAVLAIGCVVLRKGSAARAHAAAALVWVLALVAMAGFSRFNLRLALDRADTVIAACRRFESDFDRLPVSLDELVPGYMPRVPLASWTVFGAFSYEVEPQPQLTFFAAWPTLRIYVFETDRWWWDDTPMRFFPKSDEGPATARAKPTGNAAPGAGVVPRSVARTNFVSRARSEERAHASRKCRREQAFPVTSEGDVMHGTPVATSTSIAVVTN